MKNITSLEKMINSVGWFTGQLELKISIKSEFEGFYGKASEDWERQVTIEIICPKDLKFKSTKIVGNRFEGINEVAGRLMEEMSSIEKRE